LEESCLILKLICKCPA